MNISPLGKIFFISLLVAISVQAQTPHSKVALPMLASASVPLYPPLARTANVEGVVHVSVTTDGQRVASAHAQD
jgi:outer membrane biosynthesis protein TonB